MYQKHFPLDYNRIKISFQRENCLVPYDTEFRIDNKDWLKLIPNYVVQWGGKYGGKEYE